MKYKLTDTIKNIDKSLPVRGAWVEILYSATSFSTSSSLPVRGAWVEIAGLSQTETRKKYRSPCGERGLKSYCRC